MVNNLAILDLLFSGIAFYCLWRLTTAHSRSTPLPPGPRRIPILGNLLDMPASREWIKFSQWGKQYGDIMSVTVCGQVLVVINSAQIAVDLLDKKSSVYSDRPTIPMGGELIGWKNTLVLTPYGEKHRRYRRLAHQLFGNTQTMKAFYPVEELETKKFLNRLLDRPHDFADHIRKTAGAIILRISHGYEVLEGEDPFVNLAETAVEQFADSISPGLFWVNFIPSLKYVPEWVPGAGFQRTAKEWAKTLEDMVDIPYQWTKNRWQNGTAEMSYISRLLDEKPLSEQEEFDVKWSAASLYSGGADTTVAAIHAFFKAMLLFPEVQARAQQEIDEVIGHDRLPSLNDRDKLPYLNALVLEVIRWHTVAPIGITHRLSEDDVFNGYVLPKGALVITNIWNMCHDPKVFHEPMVFKPERFLPGDNQKPEPDPREVSFGFGRRICPGRVLAEASIFISCAMVLSTFNISPYSEGGVLDSMPDKEQKIGLISHPTPFRCSIKPRSNKAVDLIQEETV